MNFWDVHGLWFLIFITFFPRITLLFSSVVTGGILWWLGFFFMPRLLVACLATITYWETNPVLVFISWVVALLGEVFEKLGLKQKNRSRFIFQRTRFGGTPSYEEPPQPKRAAVDDAIEAEFTKK
jgi:hypothetical protein